MRISNQTRGALIISVLIYAGMGLCYLYPWHEVVVHVAGTTATTFLAIGLIAAIISRKWQALLIFFLFILLVLITRTIMNVNGYDAG